MQASGRTKKNQVSGSWVLLIFNHSNLQYAPLLREGESVVSRFKGGHLKIRERAFEDSVSNL